MKPRIYHEIPEGFLDAYPRDLEDLLGGPAILALPGRKKQPLFISTLLHGNEHSSIIAVQALLKQYKKRDRALPRSLIILVGNVAAAKRNARHLAGQKDYNRVWALDGDSPEHELARSVLDFAREQQPMACIDIHNNTGTNPHYGCVNYLDQNTLTLAGLFSRTVVYFTEPHEVLSNAFSQICPSITVECGLSGEWHGVEHAVEFMDAVMHIRDLSEHNHAHDSLDIYHTMARVRLPKNCLFDFGGFNPQADLRFPDNFEHLNFVEQPKGSLLGWRFNGGVALEVVDNNGEDVADRYLRYDNQEIRTQRAVIPSMFTKDKQVAASDCLGYLMERYPLPSPLPTRKEVEEGMA